MFKSIFLVGFLVLLIINGTAYAVSHVWDLDIFTDNSDYNNDSGADFYFELSEDNGLARFEFHNESTFASSITDIYFDDGIVSTLTSISNIESSAGVSFSPYAKPGNLPGGNELDRPFMTTNGLSADSDSPHLSDNGVNSATEWVALLMVMEDAVSLADINNELLNGELRVGMHIQAFSDGQSEGAITAEVPEPSTIALLALGALGLLRWIRS